MTRTFQEALAAGVSVKDAVAELASGPQETTGSTPATPDTPDAIDFAGDLIFDPRTGEILGELADEATDRLADLVLELRARETQLAEMRKQIEAELRDRLKQQGRRVATVGDYELETKTSRKRVWDGDELEGALRHLVDEGVLQVGDLTGLVTRETKVDGTKAAKLLGQLQGAAKHMIEQCFHWEDSGQPKLTVTPVAQLEARRDAGC